MTLRHLFLAKIAGTALLATAGLSTTASAEQQGYLGTMTMVGQSWCPVNWAPMNGQLLPISGNQALFSLIGCTYGGDCRSTFALPDMRSRTPVHMTSTQAGYQLGQTGGYEEVTLTAANLPAHSHRLGASDRPGTSGSPAGNDIADFTGTPINGYTSAAPDGQIMAGNTIGLSGGGQAFEIGQPYLTINYCIATQGLYPRRP